VVGVLSVFDMNLPLGKGINASIFTTCGPRSGASEKTKCRRPGFLAAPNELIVQASYIAFALHPPRRVPWLSDDDNATFLAFFELQPHRSLSWWGWPISWPGRGGAAHCGRKIAAVAGTLQVPPTTSPTRAECFPTVL
jgi:hypothetical protein